MTGDRLLLSTVGVGPYEQTTFGLENHGETRASISPIALIDLLGIDTVLLAHTATIRDDTAYLDQIREACATQNIGLQTVEVPLVEGRTDVDQILDRVGASLIRSEADSVVLDITHAHRSLQLGFYTTAVHLDALDVIDLENIYYAEDAGHGGDAQIFDLSYLAALLEWHHALRSFRTEGTLGPLQQLLTTKRDRVYRQGDTHPELLRLSKALNSVTSYLDAGLPLETGIAARDAVAIIDELDDRDFIGPEGAFLTPLSKQLEQFMIEQEDVAGKTDIELTPAELQRQQALVRFYVDTGREWIALECARELFLTRLLFTSGSHSHDWLDPDTRHTTRKTLTETAHQHQASSAPDIEALQVWEELSSYRNAHAHAGFDPDNTPTGESVKPVLETVCDRLTDDQFWTEIAELTDTT